MAALSFYSNFRNFTRRLMNTDNLVRINFTVPSISSHQSCSALSSKAQEEDENADDVVRLAHAVYRGTDKDQRQKMGEGEDQPPLVIVHGLFGHKHNWQSMAKALQNRLQTEVYTVDLRNHGDSPHHPVNSYQAMAADLAAFLADLRHPEVDLLGHSMGGKVAAELALHSPKASSLIRRLIIEDVSLTKGTGPNHESYLKYIQAMKNADLNKLRREISAHLEPAVPDLNVRLFLLTNLVSASSSNGNGFGQKLSWRWRLNLDALESSIYHILSYVVLDHAVEAVPIFDKPTLFVAGSLSNHVKYPEDVPQLRPSFPRSQFATIQDANHWVHADKPALFMDTICQFLQ